MPSLMQLLVKSLFTDAIGNKFLGYINIGLVGVEYTQPRMFVDDEPVGFWFGEMSQGIFQLNSQSRVTKSFHD